MPVRMQNLNAEELNLRESQNSRPRRRGLDEEGSCARLVKEKNSCLQQGRECGALVRSYLECMEGRQGSSAESLFLPGHGLAQTM